MKVALIGYGKMGQSIEKILLERGHTISFVIDQNSNSDLSNLNPSNTDVAIEFTGPDAAFSNINQCINNGIAVVSGSTGWLDKMESVEAIVEEKKGAFFYASNYSLGVNIFFMLNKQLAKLMKGRGYDSSIHEIHHVHKLDSPSGTAITLAEGIIEQSEKVNWTEDVNANPSDLLISSEREGEVPGTHIISYKSQVDSISMTHEAHSRQGFANGAVMAAEWIIGRKGVFGMEDYLKFSE